MSTHRVAVLWIPMLLLLIGIIASVMLPKYWETVPSWATPISILVCILYFVAAVDFAKSWMGS